MKLSTFNIKIEGFDTDNFNINQDRRCLRCRLSKAWMD